MPIQQNKKMVESQSLATELSTAANIISTPKGNWLRSNHGKDIDAGVAFLRQLNGDTAMIAFVTAHPNMCFLPQHSIVAMTTQEPQVA